METIEPPGAERISTRNDPYAALRFRDFRLLVGGTLLAVIAEQMLGVGIGCVSQSPAKDSLFACSALRA